VPELPEAETIVRGLRPPVEGRTVVAVEVVHDDVLDEPTPTFRRSLEGRRIDAVTRRGKNVILALEDGPRLVVNLGMSGRLLHRLPDDDRPEPTHPAVLFTLDDDSTLVYHDIRRFGRLHLREAEDYRKWSRTLGPEPLARRFTGRRLAQGLARSSSPIRSWLLDQRRIAGVGNIYASEALHRARIHPRTPAAEIDAAGARRLHRAIRKVLRDAVEWKGTTFRDFRTADGREGSYGQRLRVYGREGEPCPRCGARIRRIVFSNRSAFLCPRCQPEPSE
jgi:formamidopyrimidine-DNA glycosylase